MAGGREIGCIGEGGVGHADFRTLHLGELYEYRGDRDNAVRYYSELIELWKEADRELQRQVEDVRDRIVRLAQEPRN